MSSVYSCLLNSSTVCMEGLTLKRKECKGVPIRRMILPFSNDLM